MNLSWQTLKFDCNVESRGGERVLDSFLFCANLTTELNFSSSSTTERAQLQSELNFPTSSTAERAQLQNELNFSTSSTS